MFNTSVFAYAVGRLKISGTVARVCVKCAEAVTNISGPLRDLNLKFVES